MNDACLGLVWVFHLDGHDSFKGGKGVIMMMKLERVHDLGTGVAKGVRSPCGGVNELQQGGARERYIKRTGYLNIGMGLLWIFFHIPKWSRHVVPLHKFWIGFFKGD